MVLFLIIGNDVVNELDSKDTCDAITFPNIEHLAMMLLPRLIDSRFDIGSVVFNG